MTRTIIQLYRGTTAQNDAFTGSAGELSFDTTTNQVRVHDGTTVGGHIIGSGSGYHPDLFSWQWADHELNDVQWLRADTFSWQSGAVYQAAYQHLIEDYEENVLAWMWTGGVYTAHRYPSVGDKAYSDNTLTTELGTITATSDSTITVNSQVYSFNGSYTNTPSSETIAGITIQYYLSSDGHKICANGPAITAAEAIYAATGVAWYYILDVTNQRFKLPRTQFGVTGYRGTVGGYIEAGAPDIQGSFKVKNNPNGNPVGNITDTEGAFSSEDSVSGGYTKFAADANSYTGNTKAVFKASDSNSTYGNASTIQPPATQMYLYFYVGNFTQTALENTAGLNASLFNGKADLNLLNTASNVDFVIERQEPTAANNYTWYRKYRSGRVEQGGCVIGNNTDGAVPVVFPIEMADIYYYRNASLVWTTNGGTATNSGAARSAGAWQNPTTTGIEFQKQGPQSDFYWEVKGKAA